ncbi:MAG: acetylornithine deacetylase/succinyl-diaminopimelate desuccinylase family protein [Gemmatimonadota bacterium]|nr:acetylornithine deacetylase/succinyl-diaminopimelate desuccinylase family protein [Gemmatimonadota bacterium]
MDFTRELVRIPSVNPPGSCYLECADAIDVRLQAWGLDVQRLEAPGRPGRPNVLGDLTLGRPGPTVHLNGHFDVVPPGEGWTVDPFGAEVRGDRLYGRGACDMKAGLACAAFVARCVGRSGVDLAGRIQVSGTVDEESGGLAGVGALVDAGVIGAHSVDYAIIPEPFSPHRICVGHRGVLWSAVRALGRTAHGSMPHLGRSAIDDLVAFLHAVRRDLAPKLEKVRTEMPVEPEGSRVASINVNGLVGGQGVVDSQSPCVADAAEAIFDRRFLLEEDIATVRAELPEVAARLAESEPGRTYQVEERLCVLPVQAPEDSPLLEALEEGIQEVLGRSPDRVASPGTYDQKHFARGGVRHCVAYGPGRLELAHQPDEWVSLHDMRRATEVMAYALCRLLRVD